MVKLLFLSHPGSGTSSFSREAGWFGAGLLPPPSLQEPRRLGQWFTQPSSIFWKMFGTSYTLYHQGGGSSECLSLTLAQDRPEYAELL